MSDELAGGAASGGDALGGAASGSNALPDGPPPRRSALLSLTWRAAYRIVRVLDPLIRSWIANDLPGLEGIVELRVVGRRSGRSRRTLVTLLSSGGHWYVGHPNGEAGWVRNAEASGWVEIEPPGAHGPRFEIRRLERGAERDAVIRATVRQQPFPGNVLYRISQRHIAAVGVYHRLDPVGLDPVGLDPVGLNPAAAGVHPSDPEGAR